MFTGLIEEVGEIKNIRHEGDARSLDVSCRRILDDIRIDDSICLNGVCLTVERFDGSTFTATAVEETLRKTNLAELNHRSLVNLERAMKADNRFGGHYVQGHVDTTTRINNVHSETKNVLLSLDIPHDYHKFLVERGSITINGISLTIASLSDNSFTVAVIPHTIANTNLSQVNAGDTVNIEFDIIAKYVERMIAYKR